MAIAVQTGTSTPFAKLVELGDTLVGAFGGSQTRQQQEFKTGELKFKADGKPSREEVLYLVAMPGTTAKVGSDEQYQQIAEGDTVRYSVSGFKWGQVIDQRKVLPARAGFKAGAVCSGDVYTFKLVGWSATTENPAGAQQAGFTVIDGRIVMRTDDEHEKWVLNQIKKGGNTNAGKDFEITVRRPTDAEKAWEQAADELYLSKPWEQQSTAEPATGPTSDARPVWDDEAPF